MPDTVRRWRIVCTSHPPVLHTRAERRYQRHLCAGISGAPLPELLPPPDGGHAPQERGGPLGARLLKILRRDILGELRFES